MAEPIVFKLALTPHFRIAKCVNVRAGDFYYLPAAPEEADAVPGSDTLVVCPEIMLVTRGSFELTAPELGVIALHAGDAGSPQRFRGPIRIEAAEDDSAYICITPRDNSFWERQAGFVPAGETISLETPPCNSAALLVATGGLICAGSELGVGSLLRLSPGQADLTAPRDSYFVHLWR